MNQLILLAANLLLYIGLFIFQLITKSSFDLKLENYRKDNQLIIDRFRDEIFKRNRMFELKYDLYKSFSWSIQKMHWLVTMFDIPKFIEVFELVGQSERMVRNFYKENVIHSMNSLGDEFKLIAEKRLNILAQISIILGNKSNIERIRDDFIRSIQSQPTTLDDLLNRLEHDSLIKDALDASTRDQIQIMIRLISDINSDLKKVYQLGEKISFEMASELKAEFDLI